MDFEQQLRVMRAETLVAQMVLLGICNGLAQHGYRELLTEAFDRAEDTGAAAIMADHSDVRLVDTGVYDQLLAALRQTVLGPIMPNAKVS
jgi:hypothetical protein